MDSCFVKRDCCSACGEKSHQTLFSAPFMDERVFPFLEGYYYGRIPPQTLAHASYTLLRCLRCDLIYQAEIFDDAHMFLFYEKWISAEESLQKKERMKATLHRQYGDELEAIRRWRKKPPSQINILEFGMGWGHWANFAREQGFNVVGSELSERRVAFAEQNGLKIISDLDELADQSFDFIYANQVFEHLPDPFEIMQRFAQLLKPDGIIHLRVPNGRQIQQKIENGRLQISKGPVQPLEHINCYQRKSWAVLAERAGLTLRRPLYQPAAGSVRRVAGSYLLYARRLFSAHEVYFGHR